MSLIADNSSEIKDQMKETFEERNSATLCKLLSVCGPIISSMSTGFTLGFTATLFPKIVNNITDENSETWLASAVTLSMSVGFMASGIIMKYWGRKKTLILSQIWWLFGWPCISLAVNYKTLLIGFVLVGLSSGLNGSIVTVYIGEICEAKLRGIVTMVAVSFVAIGILLTHVFGIIFDWRTAQLIQFIVAALTIFLMFFTKESPTWLVVQGETKKAREIFFKLHKFSIRTQEEFKELLNKQEEKLKRKQHDLKGTILTMKFFKPLFIVSCVLLVQQGSGYYSLTFYAITQLKNMSKEIDANTCLIILDLFRIFANLISVFCVKRMGPRRLFLYSACFTFIFLVLITVSIILTLSSSVLIICLGCYVISLYIGVVPIPWLLQAEIFPIVLREFGSGASLVLLTFLSFLVLKTNFTLINNFGIIFTYGLYACFVLIGTVLCYYNIPETSEKTLQQIETAIFSKNEKNAETLNNSENSFFLEEKKIEEFL